MALSFWKRSRAGTNASCGDRRSVAIRDYPGHFSDATDPGDSGRRVEIHVCGKYAVKFWEDGAGRHVKILDVHLAGQPGR